MRVDYHNQADHRVVERSALWTNPDRTTGGSGLAAEERRDALLVGTSTLATARGQNGAFANGSFKGVSLGGKTGSGDLIQYWRHVAFRTREEAEASGGAGFMIEIPGRLPDGSVRPTHVTHPFLVPLGSCTARFINDGLHSAPANAVMVLDLWNPDPQRYLSIRASVDTQDCEEVYMEYGGSSWVDRTLLRGATRALVTEIISAYPDVERDVMDIVRDGGVRSLPITFIEETCSSTGPTPHTTRVEVALPSKTLVTTLRLGPLSSSSLSSTLSSPARPPSLATIAVGVHVTAEVEVPVKGKRKRKTAAEQLVLASATDRSTRSRESGASALPTPAAGGAAVVTGLMSALACSIAVGGGVDTKTATRYLKVGQRFGMYLQSSEWKDKYVSEGHKGLQEPLCVDYSTLANLPEDECARIAVGYGTHVMGLGRSVGADYGALRWCFTTFAFRVPPAFTAEGPALAQANKGWKKKTPRRVISMRREQTFKSLVPAEMMWIIIDSLKGEDMGTRAFMATVANVFACSRGKRGASFIHCSPQESAAEEKAFLGWGEETDTVGESGDPDPRQLGTKAEYHPLRGTDFSVMGRGSKRYDPIGICVEFADIKKTNQGGTLNELLVSLWDRIGVEFMSMTTRSDKVGCKDKVYMYRVQDERGEQCPWGSRLSDWFIQQMVKLVVLSDPLDAEDNLFSFRRTVTDGGELRHSMSLIVKKDVTAVMKSAAVQLGLPPSAFALHCYRHTFKTQQTMSATVLGAQSREAQEVMAKEWAAGSTAADGYVGDTAMGYDNLRTLSLGVPGTLVTLAEVRARLPASLVASYESTGR